MNILKRLWFFTATVYFLPFSLLAREHTKEIAPPTNQYAYPPAHKGINQKTFPFKLGASYTFWVPYASGINTQYSNGNTTAFGKITRPNLFPVSGFKVHGGIYTYHDDWKFFANYTWFLFAPDFNEAYLQNNGSITYASPFTDGPSTNYSYAQSKFRTQFNRLDGFLYKSFYTGHYVTFSPKMGLLGAWDLIRLGFNNILNLINDDEKGRLTQYWWGVGPYGGGALSYNIFQGFDLYINSGLAMLYVQHYVKSDNFILDSNKNILVAVDNSRTQFYNVEPMVEYKLGITWGVCTESVALSLDVAWETQVYFMHNGFLPYYSPTGVSGNYSMQGLTAGLTFSF